MLRREIWVDRRVGAVRYSLAYINQAIHAAMTDVCWAMTRRMDTITVTPKAR